MALNAFPRLALVALNALPRLALVALNALPRIELMAFNPSIPVSARMEKHFMRPTNNVK